MGRAERVLSHRVRSQKSGSHTKEGGCVTHRIPSPPQSSLHTPVTQAQSHIPTKTPRQSAHPALGTQEVKFKEEGTINSGKPSTEGVGENRRQERGGQKDWEGTGESGY